MPEDYAWLMEAAGGVPVIEYCGGTEIGGGYLIGTVLHDAVPAMFTTPTLGLDVRILDEEGQPADEGELFVVPPSIGLSQELLVRDHRAICYEGLPRSDVPLRRHGDHMERLPGGYYRALGRVDDTMNLGGIKISSAEIERAVGGIEGIAEIAAVAVSPPGGGPSRLVVYTVPSEGADANPEAWKRDMQQALRSDQNPLFRIEAVVVIDELPRTAFAKVMRRDLREASAPMNPLVVLRNEDMAPPGYLGDAFDRREGQLAAKTLARNWYLAAGSSSSTTQILATGGTSPSRSSSTRSFVPWADSAAKGDCDRGHAFSAAQLLGYSFLN